MTRLLLSFLLAVTCLSGCTTARNLTSHSEWRLAYAHDEFGNRTAGNIETLIAAIQDGAEVRLVVDHSKDGFTYATPLEHLWVKNQHVYGQKSDYVASYWDGDRKVFHRDAHYGMFNYSTTGFKDVMLWKFGEHTTFGAGHFTERVALKWFVR